MSIKSLFFIVIGFAAFIVIATIIAFVYVIRILNKSKSEATDIAEEDEEIQKIPPAAIAQDFIMIKDIKGDMLILPENNYMLMIETGPKNFFLLSESGFDQLDEGFGKLCLTLDENEEFHGQVENTYLDEQEFFEQCRKEVKKNRDYNIRKLMTSVLNFFGRTTKGQIRRRNFILVPYKLYLDDPAIAEIENQDERDYYAFRQLLDKAFTYIEILNDTMGITAQVLSGNALVDVIYKHLNKEFATDLSLQDMINSAHMAMYCVKSDERFEHLTKQEQVVLQSLGYTKSEYIKLLEEEYERRLVESIENMEKDYEEKYKDSYDFTTEIISQGEEIAATEI